MNSQDYRNLQEAYLEVYHELDEGAAGDVAARAYKLASQRKGQTPERKKMYGDLFNKASARERKPHNTDWKRQGLTQKQRDSRREIDVEYSDETGLKNSTDGPGTITKNKRKLAQQKARGQHAEQYMDEAQSYDLYDIILSHLIDEGYADTEEAAERIMVNMSEEWRESIFEEVEQLDEVSDKLATAARNLRQKRYTKSADQARNLQLSKGNRADMFYKNFDKTVKLNDTLKSREKRTGTKIPRVEQLDLYDIILSHLIAEGYADTQEAAEAIMVNMSEEWRESIFEEVEQLDELSDKLVTAARDKLAKRTNKSVNPLSRRDTYGQDINRETRMNDQIQARNRRTGSNVEPTFTRRHEQLDLYDTILSKESFNIFVNTMISEGISMDRYSWEEIQNVFEDLFEAQVANRNPDEYERKAKQGQSYEQRLKSQVRSGLDRMDPDKRAAMIKQMRAVGLNP